jgi:hypothetical protein
MTYRIEAHSGGAGPTADGVWCLNAGNDFDVMIRNVGNVTVFIGPVDPNGSTGVDTNSGYPLLPGETITVPNPASASHRVGFSTEEGHANFRILTVVTE